MANKFKKMGEYGKRNASIFCSLNQLPFQIHVQCMYLCYMFKVFHIKHVEVIQ